VNPGDTILARATPPGRSSRAVVRLSGPHTPTLLAERTHPAVPARRGLFVTRLDLGGGSLPVLVARFVTPASYTGEEAAEIHLPGNPWLVERVIADLASIPGVRRAEPGEFSARAYLAGKLTLDQAEGVAATIAAQTEAQLAAARGVLAGRFGDAARAWADETAALLALVEAGIDFTDQEDVVAIAPADLARRVGSVAASIGEYLGSPAAESVSERPRVLLVGPPNAGKSTLFNALLGHARAVVSAVAGTTRDALVEPLDLAKDLPGAGVVDLIDAAGLDAAPADRIEAQAQHALSREIRRADVLIRCAPDGDFAEPLPARPDARLIRVRTKADRTSAVANDADVIPLCALDGWNLPELRRSIASAAWGGLDQVRAVVPRHRAALAAARGALAETLVTLKPHADARTLRDPEILAGSLRAALDALGTITGRMSPDEVLGRVFATFCVGK
jgi:tRNA modification GTPase